MCVLDFDWSSISTWMRNLKLTLSKCGLGSFVFYFDTLPFGHHILKCLDNDDIAIRRCRNPHGSSHAGGIDTIRCLES